MTASSKVYYSRFTNHLFIELSWKIISLYQQWTTFYHLKIVITLSFLSVVLSGSFSGLFMNLFFCCCLFQRASSFAIMVYMCGIPIKNELTTNTYSYLSVRDASQKVSTFIVTPSSFFLISQYINPHRPS